MTRNDWIPIGISLLALVGTLGNYVLTLSRGRKHVRISWSIAAPPGSPPTYKCRVTNTGYIGLQVANVRVPWGGNIIGAELHLPSGESARKLDQGESQVWETELEPLLNIMSSVDKDPKDRAILVVVDTAGKKYVKNKGVPTIQDLLNVRANTA